MTESILEVYPGGPDVRLRFRPDDDGPLALEPSALGRLYGPRLAVPLPYGLAPVGVGVGSVAVVTIDGPLRRGGSDWCDGYESITSRVTAALAAPEVRAVVLRISSPGGVVAGCFEAVRAIRDAKARAGKPVVAFADEECYSAAYALACAADKICLPPSGRVGSVGVMQTLTDMSQALAAEGMRVQVVTSGAQKADGHPAVPLSDEVLARTQAVVDALAGQFAALVGEARGMSAAAVLALQAGCFLGADAVTAGLADRVCNLAGALGYAADLAAARRPAARPVGGKMLSVLTALGLAPDATEAEATRAVAGLRSQLSSLEALTGATGPEALGVIHAWKASHGRVEAVERELAAQAKAREAQERASLLDGAVADGKLSPAERSAYDAKPELRDLPLAAVRAIVATMPARVAVASVVTGPAPDAAAGLSAAELAAGARFGLTPAELSASKAALAAHRARAGRPDRDAE